jgi:hypothetical protein
MRDYAKIGPKFWIGDTGKALRKAGPATLIVAMYLVTCPSSNMLGLYYLPLPTLAHETGLGLEGASEGLRRCCEVGFCGYDEDAEVVWVTQMARFQVAEVLKAGDNRCKGIQSDYDALPTNRFLEPFFHLYSEAFHLTSCRGSDGVKQAPLKPLRSQEQEQEQEQDKEQQGASAGADAPPSSDPIPYKRIASGYNAAMVNLPKIRELTPARKTAIRTAWQGSKQRQSLAFWDAFWIECAADKFLNGAGPYAGEHSNWRPDFDYLIRGKTVTKVFEKAMDRMDRAQRAAAQEQAA